MNRDAQSTPLIHDIAAELTRPLTPLATLRQHGVILLVDVVESVRLMVQHEEVTVARWCEFLDWVQADVLQRHQGQLVKSLGDGLLMVFHSSHSAWLTVQELHRALFTRQWAVPDDQRIWLRAGLHCDWVYQHRIDVFGAAPNLASRLASLAGAGETLCSPQVWAQLSQREDVQAEDLGLCWLKHLDEPVQVYRLLAVQPGRLVQSPPVALPPASERVLTPLIAVMPAQITDADGSGHLLGDLLAQGLIERLARVPGLQVTDALSSGLLGVGKAPHLQQRASLKADFTLDMRGRVVGERLLLNAQLYSGQDDSCFWSMSCSHPLTDVFDPDSELLGSLADEVVRQLMRRCWQQTRHQLVPNLPSHALMLAGIEGLHGASPETFIQARQLLEDLSQRHPRLPTPRTWLSQWHVLSVTRGLQSAAPRQVQHAMTQVRLALEHQPDHAFAWATRAMVECHLLRDPERARTSVLESLRLAPSQAHAWLYRTTIECLLGNTAEAYAAGQRSLKLAPLGPLRYYQCCLVGHAALFDGRPIEALRLLEESCALNPYHSPTWRMLVVAHHDLDQLPQAQQCLRELLRLEPGLTVETYLARSPGGHAHRARFAAAMAAVGLPLK
jgi:adenylate cyclase